MDSKKIFPRFPSLDVFRGITVALMVLVNSPGNQQTYSWLQHSAWDGCTLADLVFPFFIVIVGISSVLALANLTKKGLVSNRELFIKITRRSLYLFMIGLFLNAFPHHFDFSTLRFFGVLQRIAICYFFSSILFLTTTKKTQFYLLSALLIGYWLLLTYFSSFSALSVTNNPVGYLDHYLFSSQHLYTKQFDPEGLLSTLPAIASVLLGNLIGFCLLSSQTKQEKLQWMFSRGMLLCLLGWGLSFICPLNKPLWSSSYVLWTGGLSLLGLAACFALIEVKQITTWSTPFSFFGKNAMPVYVLHILFLKLQAFLLISDAYGNKIGLRPYLTNLFFGNLTSMDASLCYALSYTLFWLFIIKSYQLIKNLPKKNRLRSSESM